MNPFFTILTPEQPASPVTKLSYSTLLIVEQCPKKWALLNAKYADLEGRYPITPTIYLATGTIVHEALDRFGTMLAAAGHPVPKSREFLEVRRKFPVRDTIRELRTTFLDQIQLNPRADLQTLHSSLLVDDCISAFKRLVYKAYDLEQTTLSSASDSSCPAASPVPKVSSVHTKTANSKDFRALPSVIPSPAVLSEVPIEINQPPLMGRIDLVFTSDIGDVITDFKTGEPHPEHEFQSKLYAAMWCVKTGRQVRKRVITYLDYGTEEFPGLSLEEASKELEELQPRIRSALKAIGESLACPSSDNCAWCSVRQLCEPYWCSDKTENCRWTVNAMLSLSPRERTWRDIELILSEAEIVDCSMIAVRFVLNPERGTSKLLKCAIPNQFSPDTIKSYNKLRVLNVSCENKAEGVTVVWSRLSEAFWG